MSRSPIELLGAILDEVEGLRQTDPRSHLPVPLMLELREALTDNTGSSRGATNMLRHIQALQGETIAHAFDCWIKRGNMVFVTTSGAFLVLEAEANYDSEADLNVLHTSDASISDYLEPHALMLAGIVTPDECRALESRAMIEEAEAEKQRAVARLRRAEKAVAKARATLPPTAPPAAGEAAA